MAIQALDKIKVRIPADLWVSEVSMFPVQYMARIAAAEARGKDRCPTCGAAAGIEVRVVRAPGGPQHSVEITKTTCTRQWRIVRNELLGEFATSIDVGPCDTLPEFVVLNRCAQLLEEKYGGGPASSLELSQQLWARWQIDMSEKAVCSLLHNDQMQFQQDIAGTHEPRSLWLRRAP